MTQCRWKNIWYQNVYPYCLIRAVFKVIMLSVTMETLAGYLKGLPNHLFAKTIV